MFSWKNDDWNMMKWDHDDVVECKKMTIYVVLPDSNMTWWWMRNVEEDTSAHSLCLMTALRPETLHNYIYTEDSNCATSCVKVDTRVLIFAQQIRQNNNLLACLGQSLIIGTLWTLALSGYFVLKQLASTFVCKR